MRARSLPPPRNRRHSEKPSGSTPWGRSRIKTSNNRPYAARRTKPARSGDSFTARSSNGCEPCTTIAPSTEPVRFAMPPKMTMAKMASEIEKPNTPGVARWRYEEYRPPARPASIDAMAKTSTL